MSDRKDKRTTVSLAHVVWDMATESMEAKGFNDNFSAYIADLIRRDRERTLGKANAATSAFAARRTGTDSLNDAAAAPRSPFRAPRSPKPRKP